MQLGKVCRKNSQGAIDTLKFTGKKQGMATKFQKGTSGNPAGKPKGAKDKRTALRSLLEPHREELVKIAVEKALGGDAAALRICMDRLIAPIRSNPVQIKLTGTLTERGDAVMAALGGGTIGVDEAASLMAVIQSQARIIEADELAKRVAALEARLAEGNKHGGS